MLPVAVTAYAQAGPLMMSFTTGSWVHYGVRGFFLLGSDGRPVSFSKESISLCLPPPHIRETHIKQLQVNTCKEWVSQSRIIVRPEFHSLRVCILSQVYEMQQGTGWFTKLITPLFSNAKISGTFKVLTFFFPQKYQDL